MLPRHEARARGLRPLLRRDRPVRRATSAGAGRAEEARARRQHDRRCSWATTGRRSSAARGRSTSSASTCPLLVRWPGKVKPGASDGRTDLRRGLRADVPGGRGRRGAEGDDRPELPAAAARASRTRGASTSSPSAGAHGSGLPTNSAEFDLGRCVIAQEHKLIYNALWQIPYYAGRFRRRRVLEGAASR